MKTEPRSARRRLPGILFSLALLVVLFWFSALAWKEDEVAAGEAKAKPLTIELLGVECQSEPPFKAILSWDLGESFDGQVQLRIDSASGALFAAGESVGQAETEDWVVPGMTFVLLNQGDGSVITELRVAAPSCEQGPEESEVELQEEELIEEELIEEELRVEEPSEDESPEVDSLEVESIEDGSQTQEARQRSAAAAQRRSASASAPPEPAVRPGIDPELIALDDRASLTLSPPRLRYCGLPVEQATVRVNWDASELDASRVQIFLESLDGRMLAEGNATGERLTGDWVTNGMRFLLYLPEAGKIVAMNEFRILPCDVVEYPDEPGSDEPEQRR